jgi:hypothetical protein
MTTKVPVTERALLQRINRKLAPEWQAVRKLRGDSHVHDLGRFYGLDTYRNTIEATHIDLEAWGRELGVLAPYEALAEGD